VVEMGWLVLKFKLLQVADLAEKANQEPVTGIVVTMGSGLSLCCFVGCCSHLTNIQNFWLLW